VFLELKTLRLLFGAMISINLSFISFFFALVLKLISEQIRNPLKLVAAIFYHNVAK